MKGGNRKESIAWLYLTVALVLGGPALLFAVTYPEWSDAEPIETNLAAAQEGLLAAAEEVLLRDRELAGLGDGTGSGQLALRVSAEKARLELVEAHQFYLAAKDAAHLKALAHHSARRED